MQRGLLIFVGIVLFTAVAYWTLRPESSTVNTDQDAAMKSLSTSDARELAELEASLPRAVVDELGGQLSPKWRLNSLRVAKYRQLIDGAEVGTSLPTPVWDEMQFHAMDALNVLTAKGSMESGAGGIRDAANATSWLGLLARAGARTTLTMPQRDAIAEVSRSALTRHMNDPTISALAASALWVSNGMTDATVWSPADRALLEEVLKSKIAADLYKKQTEFVGTLTKR